MVSILHDGVKTAKKRSRHPIDYRCPFCGSRKWVKRTRDRHLYYKYKCSGCGCEFDELKSIFIVVDESNDDNRLVECISCGRLYTFGELPLAVGVDSMRVIQCECEEATIRVGVDINGNRVVDIGYIHDNYIKDKIKHEE